MEQDFMFNVRNRASFKKFGIVQETGGIIVIKLLRDKIEKCFNLTILCSVRTLEISI
jgi:hypothetical protein